MMQFEMEASNTISKVSNAKITVVGTSVSNIKIQVVSQPVNNARSSLLIHGLNHIQIVFHLQKNNGKPSS
jgi:hypothetical protein